MARKPEAPPKLKSAPTEAEIAADKVRAERQARRPAKAAAAEAKLP